MRWIRCAAGWVQKFPLLGYSGAALSSRDDHLDLHNQFLEQRTK